MSLVGCYSLQTATDWDVWPELQHRHFARLRPFPGQHISGIVDRRDGLILIGSVGIDANISLQEVSNP